MTKRAAAVEEKRRAIVRATLDLHAEKGVERTGWDDIAARAGVGVGTVYRHFPSLDELLPACGALTFQKLALPDAAAIRALDTRAERVRRLVDELFSLYGRGEAELRNVRNESSYHPVLAEARSRIEARITELVAAAVAEKRDVVGALTDLGTWQALRSHHVADPARSVTELILQLFDAGTPTR